RHAAMRRLPPRCTATAAVAGRRDHLRAAAAGQPWAVHVTQGAGGSDSRGRAGSRRQRRLALRRQGARLAERPLGSAKISGPPALVEQITDLMVVVSVGCRKRKAQVTPFPSLYWWLKIIAGPTGGTQCLCARRPLVSPV